MINTSLQSVVEVASKAHRRRAMRNPAVYLRSAYQYRANKLLDRERRTIGMESVSFGEARIERTDSWERNIHQRLVLEKIFEAMAPTCVQLRVYGWRGIR